ncbi:hypothetical protein CsSME_00002790 [Camellia sinensis var. sinensis]
MTIGAKKFYKILGLFSARLSTKLNEAQPCTLNKSRRGAIRKATLRRGLFFEALGTYLQGFKTLQYKITKHGQKRAESDKRLNVGESHGIKGDTETSTSRRRVRREEIQEKEGSSSVKDTTHAPVLEHYYHPCHYLGLAKQAFLKCLGLDPPSKDSSNTRRRKEQ